MQFQWNRTTSKLFEKESKVPIDLNSAIYSVLYAGRNAIDIIFNPILDRLGIEIQI